ncbi:MAG TPA: asparaginase [Pyrinomonadaceae bacterium]|nr:asparaginase [Pyrinomonadaceae bacterium]
MNAEVLAHVIRGETVESVHSGHIIVLDGERNTVGSIGDPSTITYFRSACKAFQAIPCITSGAADAFGFTADKIAMACASHSGENVHVELASRMLEKIGLSETDLRCGVHIPFNESAAKNMLRVGEEPTQLHNNCSGKHAAMLAFAKHIGADLDTYNQADNRIQKRILRCIADFTEIPEDSIATGIDGCCAPNFAIPLTAMAVSFINLMSPTKFHESIQAACARVVEAMMKYPELIGGSERLDTMLMQAAPGRLVSKVGADGVWCGAVLPCDKWPTGLGIALKVADGDDYRGRPVIVVEILRQLGILGVDDLADLSPSPIKNRRGDVVGKVAPVFDLAI